VFGFECLADVFTDQERAGKVPFFTTASSSPAPLPFGIA
jgi:hypothetical protein